MEISPWTVYWVLQLDTITIALRISIGAVGIAGVFIFSMFLAFFDSYSEDFVRQVRKLFKIYLVVLFAVLSAVLLIPDTKTALAMYTVPKLAKSGAVEQLKGDAKELYILGVERLKEELKGRAEQKNEQKH